MRSMTGFAEKVVEVDGIEARVTIRSVNHKAFSPQFQLPESLLALEPSLRERLGKVVSRGRVDVRVRCARTRGESETHRAKLFADELKALASAAGIASELTLSDFIAAGGLTHVRTSEGLEGATPAVSAAFEAALETHDVFRQREGESLRRHFEEELDVLEHALFSISERRQEAYSSIREGILRRIAELAVDVEVAPGRIEEEIVVQLQRADIEEEIRRATEHLAELRRTLQRRDEPIGKRVGFLLQELVRETNTMASKSQDAPLTRAVVDAKTAVERMREQSMNVE